MSVELAGLDHDSLEKMIGPECYETALEYVRRKAVSQQIWIASQNALFGIVDGRYGDHYTPTVYLSRQGPVPVVKAARCNCAASYGCEHAAALLIAAVTGATTAGGAGNDSMWEGSLAVPRQAARRHAWDTSLESWLAAGREAGRTGEATLAIELTLEADQAGRPPVPRLPGQEHGFPGPLPVRLMARLVQPGKQGGWVGGSLSWGKLGGYGYYSGPSATQTRLLRELVALYRTRVSSPGYYYPGGDERAIELSAIESSRLWPLLDEARQAGLPLVYRRKLGPVEGYREAELGLDVTGDEDGGGLAVTPVIRLDGPSAGPGTGSPAGAGSPAAGVAGPGEVAGAGAADVVPVRFIGAQGHGLVYLDGAEAGRSAEPGDWRFRLARLRRAVPEPLQEMALAGQRLVIPAAGLARFREEFYPRLRQMATVTSSDGAFTPPDISGPTLVLCASYGTEHDVQVHWKWAYQVGDARLRSDLGASPEDTGYRDTRAELAILDRLALSGVLDGELASRAMAPGTRFRGLDTVRFTTELLPLLSRQPGLAVEVTGDPADYREVSDSLCVSVSADAVDGDPDWFDLGITLMAEGRKIPFADVFTALTLGQSHLLLPGGAYFSLDRPELRQLAQLIKEARALPDAPGDQLRISRFQAGLWAELTALGVVERQALAWQEQVQGLLDLGQAGPFDPAGQLRPPGTLHAELRSYQLEGFQWLAFLWRHRLGGILADDMGLGKTLETLALICHARQADPDGAPFLVVAPTSVVPNWAAEAARFAPGLTVVTITDTLARRGAELSELIAGADLVVTSYTLLRLDFDAHAATGWSGLVLDEAQ